MTFFIVLASDLEIHVYVHSYCEKTNETNLLVAFLFILSKCGSQEKFKN